MIKSKKTYSIIIFMLIIGILGYLSLMSSSGNPQVDVKRTDKYLLEELRVKDSIINEYRSLLDSNKRLYQHYVAVKYSKLPPTASNIQAFIKEAKLTKQKEAFAVAKLETNNGQAGIGKAPRNNHFGLTLATTRFSWNDKIVKNYCSYSSWPFSYLDYEEYVKKGYSDWQKDAVKKVFKKTQKKATKHKHKKR